MDIRNEKQMIRLFMATMVAAGRAANTGYDNDVAGNAKNAIAITDEIIKQVSEKDTP